MVFNWMFFFYPIDHWLVIIILVQNASIHFKSVTFLFSSEGCSSLPLGKVLKHSSKLPLLLASDSTGPGLMVKRIQFVCIFPTCFKQSNLLCILESSSEQMETAAGNCQQAITAAFAQQWLTDPGGIGQEDIHLYPTAINDRQQIYAHLILVISS